MKRSAAFCFLWTGYFLVAAQSPEVPHKMVVAGITLTIRDDARREIQEDVNALTRSAKHFEVKVQRARTYFPIIEQIFREERVPDDFKYLVLQESALIPDAVSVSNAVGYWQFKDFTAQEMGLRMDDQVDERMNIVSSTRAAARYLKKNNYYFNNWIYALQAYQMGAGAVMRSVKDYESGARHMEITSSTYWYVKKFLAHKIAFEQAVQGPAEVKLITVDARQKTLSDVAREMQVNESDLVAYNMWARKNTIPDDKPYVVVVPVTGTVSAAVATAPAARPHTGLTDKPDYRSQRNGIPVIVAAENDTWATLAAKAGLSLRRLLRYNDCSISDKVVAGSFYYTRPKRGKTGLAAYHVVQPGESLWWVSQQYGISLNKLRKLNPGVPDKLPAGTTIYFTRSDKKSVSPDNMVQVDTGDAFAWTADPPSDLVAVEQVGEPVSGTTTSSTLSPGVHRVQAGETLYAISKKYGLSVHELQQLNHLAADEPIKPGQLLKVAVSQPTQLQKIHEATTPDEPLPEGKAVQAENTLKVPPAAAFKLYEVKPADTLYSIARQHGVTIKELMDWNGKKDFSVTPGEKLKIAQR